MTIQEAAKIVHMIHTAYPVDRKATAEDLADRIDLWAVYFADYDAELVARVAKAWIESHTFMPTIDEIKNACDVRRRIGEKLANAVFIPDDLKPLPPEEVKRLEGIWRDIVQTEIEIEGSTKE